MRIARCQQEDVRAAFLIADGVELGVAATFGDADTNMGQAPPFAPQAVRWTLMQYLSMKSFYGHHIHSSEVGKDAFPHATVRPSA